MEERLTVDYYMRLPYTIELRNEPEDAGWFVRVKELRGCMSEGDTAEEALAMIREAMELWLEVALEEGIPIPEPRPDEDYSGKFVVRVPRSLHRELVEEARRQGTSLNQAINVALARSVGRTVSTRSATEEPGWPGLKTAVRRVLSAAGLGEDAGELDERLFAGWVDQCLSEVEGALRDGAVQDALEHLDLLTNGLRDGGDTSPVLVGFRRALLLLRRQVETRVGLKPGTSYEQVLHPPISRVIQRSDRPLAQMAIHDASVPYAAAEPEAGQRVEPPAGEPDPDGEDRVGE